METTQAKKAFLALSIGEQAEKLRKLSEEMQKTLRIEAFLPGAFAHGPCSIGGSHNPYNFAGAEVHFTLGNGEKKKFPASEVPRDLWPEELQRSFPVETTPGRLPFLLRLQIRPVGRPKSAA
jgi:hypothetical protein